MRQVERHNLLQQPSPALQAVLLALHGCQALRELRHLLLILPHALLQEEERGQKAHARSIAECEAAKLQQPCRGLSTAMHSHHNMLWLSPAWL